MSKSVAQQRRVAVHVERELVSLLSDKSPPRFEDVDNFINQLRSACESIIFLDFEYAYKEGIERRLWEAHTKINQRYRKIVDHYRGAADHKKHVVERRKLEKRYADFLKTSQFFYKGFVQRLASHFVGLKDLRRIAHRLSLSTMSVGERVKVPSDMEHHIDLSCHATLLRLGDLSRYRNNLRSKERSWETALDYYGLANDLFPEDGSAHNQMAVIALSDANHLDAVYHLYRALAIDKPHPLAKGNLEIEFKKIASAWDKQRSQPQTDSLSALIWWFVLLHSKYYEGVEFSTRQELEKEVLSRLAILLKDQTFDHVLEKLVLINIAAESFAGQKIREANGNHTPESICSFYFCFDFNIRMMSTLLQVLQPELKPNTNGENLPNDESPSGKTSEGITTVIRRVLPALRQYSVWFVSQIEVVIAKLDRGGANFHINELWGIYANVLTKLATVFPPERLPSLDYLLEEDENTIGFKPLRDRDFPHECNPYTSGPDGNLKLRITDQGVERHLPNKEMKARVRDILLCGLVLQGERYTGVPIVLRDGRFLHNEEQSFARIPTPVQSPTSDFLRNISNKSGSNSNPSEWVGTSQQVVPGNITFASDPQNNIDDDMHRFVDDLVGPEKTKSAAGNETSYGMHNMTANEIFLPAISNEVKSQDQTTSSMLPSLPGIWSTPFTPQLNELQHTSPNQLNLSRKLSPLGLATPLQRMAAAAHLDQLTGLKQSPKYSWGENNPGPQLKPLSPARNNFLKEELVRSSVPLDMSSDFPDDSSIYINTPIGHHRSNKSRGIVGNNSNFYPGASDFDTEFMLQSSLFPIDSQRHTGGYSQTPPGGQGG
ncbi:hypothetical protein BJ875DRAFT_269051 [Amylocarpus encephaloides]|uniref:DNA/RNA-binding domain-containing protein n=1 Tax=Amylocarpus encephaloides TaxID=45428 RepID=A0A9P8C7X6_9HELO|nr:hypothetical protein BJ875DRAFT_269051 [Amylocarpus encephaloides]